MKFLYFPDCLSAWRTRPHPAHRWGPPRCRGTGRSRRSMWGHRSRHCDTDSVPDSDLGPGQPPARPASSWGSWWPASVSATSAPGCHYPAWPPAQSALSPLDPPSQKWGRSAWSPGSLVSRPASRPSAPLSLPPASWPARIGPQG